MADLTDEQLTEIEEAICWGDHKHDAREAIAEIRRLREERDRLLQPDGARVVAIGGEMLTGAEIYARCLEDRELLHAERARADEAERRLKHAEAISRSHQHDAGVNLRRAEAAEARVVERNRTAASVLGGEVEGKPTSEVNWIQRARALVAIEARVAELERLRKDSEP